MEATRLQLPGTEDFFTQEAYKFLRTNLQFCGKDTRTIAVTSCGENEGKTTVALSCAKSFAEMGKRVLVIDADMRKSVMAGRNTDVKQPVGLSEVLSGFVDLPDAVYQTQYTGLHLVFAGKYPPNPAELLGSTYFGALLARCRSEYDYVLVDTPPLGAVIDAAVVGSQCDGVMLVIGDQMVRYPQAQEVLDQLRKSKCHVLGVVRNQTRAHGKGYYKGYYKRGGYYKHGYYKHGYYKHD